MPDFDALPVAFHDAFDYSAGSLKGNMGWVNALNVPAGNWLTSGSGTITTSTTPGVHSNIGNAVAFAGLDLNLDWQLTWVISYNSVAGDHDGNIDLFIGDTFNGPFLDLNIYGFAASPNELQLEIQGPLASSGSVEHVALTWNAPHTYVVQYTSATHTLVLLVDGVQIASVDNTDDLLFTSNFLEMFWEQDASSAGTTFPSITIHDVEMRCNYTGNSRFATSVSGTYTTAAWQTLTQVMAWGEGGGCGVATTGEGGGGGGAFASNTIATVGSTPYSITCHGGSAVAADGSDSYFDAGASVLAKGGKGAATTTGGLGGASASCVGTVKFSGGRGGNGSASAGTGGGGGGGGAGINGAGGSGVASSGAAGGAGGASGSIEAGKGGDGANNNLSATEFGNPFALGGGGPGAGAGTNKNGLGGAAGGLVIIDITPPATGIFKSAIIG